MAIGFTDASDRAIPGNATERAAVRWHLSSWKVELGWTCAAAVLTIVLSGLLALAYGKALWSDDFQSQYLPICTEIDRALREGSYPLLSINSWYGGDLVGEYQHGTFSVVHILIILFVYQLHLSLPSTAAALVGIYQVILATGSFRLARHLGLTVPNAMVATLAATLNGYMFYWGAWNWMNVLSSFAWLPWAWWAMQFAVDRPQGRWRFVPAGVLLYLLFAAGQPFTDLMAATVTVWLVAKNWHLPKRRLWPVAAAWALGLALASPAIFALLEYHSFTRRSTTWSAVGSSRTMPLSAFLGTVVPPMPASGTDYCAIDVGPMELRHSYEASCGLVPCVALLAILIRRWDRFVRKRGWELAMLAFAVMLCYWGEFGAFRWSFRWLPLFHLILGLLGGFAVQDWALPDEREPHANRDVVWFARPSVWFRVLLAAMLIGIGIESPHKAQTCGYVAVLGCLLAFVYWVRRVPWWEGSRGQAVFARWSEYPGSWSCLLVSAVIAYVWIVLPSFMPSQFTLVGLLLLGISAVWMLGNRWFPMASQTGSWLPVLIVVLALTAGAYRSDQTLPRWPLSETIRQPEPLERARTYLAVLTQKDVFTKDADVGEINRFGNTAMYAGLSFFNGYTPMHPKRLAEVFSISGMGQKSVSGQRILKNYIAAGGLLSQMGIDGLILGNGFGKYADLVRRSGWELNGYFPHGMVFVRPGRPTPRVRSLAAVVSVDDDGKLQKETVQGNATVRAVRESRLSVCCQVRNTDENHDAVVAFSRAYYPGYRVYLNGVEMPVECLAGIQTGVRIAPNAAGELLLVFWPKSVAWGIGIALSAIVATVVFCGSSYVSRIFAFCDVDCNRRGSEQPLAAHADVRETSTIHAACQIGQEGPGTMPATAP